ncbi:MAG: sigma 54-interacting transcriptional regulator, partial [Acidobacteriota bacterium]
RGFFESAHGGTLFLDEIGDMAPEVQAKILRALQKKEIFRLGGTTARPADVRVVSATHRDVEVMIESGDFRRDLFHRIADWRAHLPPLRDRAGDIGNLAAYFFAQATSGDAKGFSKKAWAALRAYRWPGNIRQLEREIKRAVLFVEPGELLDTSCLSPEVVAAVDNPGPGTLKAALEDAERAAIRDALAATAGDVPAAAEALEVPVSTLYRKIKARGGLEALLRDVDGAKGRRS